MIRRTLLALMLAAPLALATTGCNSNQVAELPTYSPENPYIPGGARYVTYEESLRGRNITEDSVVTHTAIGAGSGALLGQAIGKDTDGTVMGTAIGAGVGLIAGLNDEDRKRKLHEDQYRRLANQWEADNAAKAQAWRDVRTGQSMTDEDLAMQQDRLRRAQEELEERDRAAERARKNREIEEEIRRTDGTITTYPY